MSDNIKFTPPEDVFDFFDPLKPWARTMKPFYASKLPEFPTQIIEIYQTLPSEEMPFCKAPQGGRAKVYLPRNHNDSQLRHIPLPFIAAHEIGHALGWFFGAPYHSRLQNDFSRMGGIANVASPYVYPSEVEAWDLAEAQIRAFDYAKQECLRSYDWAEKIWKEETKK